MLPHKVHFPLNQDSGRQMGSGKRTLLKEEIMTLTRQNKWIQLTCTVLLTLSFGCSEVLARECVIQDSNKVEQHSARLIFSPDKKKAVSIISRNGRPELWVMKADGTEKRKVSKLRKDEGVMTSVWSPDGKLIAFVSYNLAGHSPMTTTHVWVVQSDGQGLRKVTLPKPYERFSTYSPEWKTNEILIVRAITLADTSEQAYAYTYRTGKIEKLNSEQKEE